MIGLNRKCLSWLDAWRIFGILLNNDGKGTFLVEHVLHGVLVLLV